jgi:CRISPR type III-B/RAMP module RAMP protein Cmr6
MRIPIAADVAELIGEFAERVENRSLLLDKFAFHKDWGMDYSRAHDASRWSLLRVSERGPAVLQDEATRRREQSQRLAARNPEKANRLREESDHASRMASTKVGSTDLTALRARHTRRFVSLFRAAFADRAEIVIAQLEGRLAINLADSLIQNAGLCLDRLFGLPYIPGTAVKGVARACALAELLAATQVEKAKLFRVFRQVFGTAVSDFERAGELVGLAEHLGAESQDYRGRVCFLPAYPVNEARVVVDLTNVHFPEYYRTGDGQRLAAAGEQPRPNPFPAVERGAQFGFCLVASRGDTEAGVLPTARRWLEEALTSRGLGAKTAAGYGWFSLRPEVLEVLLTEEREEAEAAIQAESAKAKAASKAAAEAQRRASLDPVAGRTEELLALDQQRFAELAKALQTQDEITQRAFLALLVADKEKREDWKRWNKKKPDIARAIRGVAEGLKVKLP